MNRDEVRLKKSSYRKKDIVSNLPNFIIGRILSFLSIKEAVRTSVLSKRWRHLWKFITNLHFDDTGPYSYRRKEKRTRFVQFVNSVLHRLNSSTIQSLSLYLSVKYEPRLVNDCISAVLYRGVKELCINSTEIIHINRHSLLESPNLEKLVLNMKGLVITIPTFLCLSSLTVLKLFGIRLTCDLSKRSQNLNLNLPVLRNYKEKNCTWSNVKDATFEVPSLEALSIKHSRFRLRFRTTRLTKFSYDSYMIEDTFSLELDPSSARISSVNIHPRMFKGENEEKTALLAYKLLKQFHSNIERLEFKRSVVLNLVKDSFVTDPLKFEMLSYLELENVNGEILLMFLMCTPFLKTLILKVLMQFEKELLDPQLVPPCFESNLQVVHFGRLNGDEHEMRFAKYVLENAQVLETANYSVTYELRTSNFEHVKNKIFSLKRSDKLAIMEFTSF